MIGSRFGVQRFARMLLRRHMAGISGSGVCVSHYSVGGWDATTHELIQFSCRLLSPKVGNSERLVFDLTDLPFDLDAYWCNDRNVEFMTRGGGHASPRYIAVVNRARTVDWTGILVNFRFRAATGVSPDFVVLPDMAPRLLALPSRACVDQPHTELDPAFPGWNLIPAVRAAGPAGERVVQAVLLKAPTARLAATQSVCLSSRFSAGLTERELTRVTRLSQNILDFYTEFFNKPLLGTVLVATPSEVRLRTRLLAPGCILAEPEQFGLRAQAGNPTDALLARHVVSLWWGGGCRLVGPFSRELEYSLASAASLLWQRSVGGEDMVRRRLSRYERALVGTRLSDLAYAAVGEMRPAVTYSLVCSLFRSFANDDHLMHTLRELLSSHWGQYLDSHEMLAALAKAGVALPRPLRTYLAGASSVAVPAEPHLA